MAFQKRSGPTAPPHPQTPIGILAEPARCRVEGRRALVQGCTRLHQQSPPSRRNDKSRRVDGGLPCPHPSCTSSVSRLQHKHVTAAYGGVRKRNNLGLFSCAARRQATARMPWLTSQHKALRSTRGQIQPQTEFSYFGISRAGLATVSGHEGGSSCRYNLRRLSALPAHETA